MRAKFYNTHGKLVWECTKDAKYYLNNGTKAIQKGATKGFLLCSDNKLIESVEYR